MLLLPIAPDLEDASLTAAQVELARLGIANTDRATWLLLQLERWRESGIPPATLAQMVGTALRAGDPEFGAALARYYFALHGKLVKSHGFTHSDASLILSGAGLAGRLAKVEHMSAAQIATVVMAQRSSLAFTWQAIREILGKLRLTRTITLQAVSDLFDTDKRLELLAFADAGIEAAAALVGDVAARFGFQGDLRYLLLDLYPPQGERHGPYLQVLHYQCIIAEFYDHPSLTAYEFVPRGNVATWVFNQYPSSFGVRGNPYLNNAKAEGRLDREWALSKKTAQAAPARALVAILTGLEEMPFAARRELAGWLRRWVFRLIRLNETPAYVLPSSPSISEIKAVLTRVKGRETRTAGIIEQRVVDALSSFRHPIDEGWRARGLGDSVNASNVSRRKLGDCDFQRAEDRQAVAYEAHAGLLTDVYIQSHQQTLRRVLPLRLEEWSGTADAAEWRLKVVFVAHAFNILTLPHPEITEGVSVTYELQLFDTFVTDSLELPGLEETFDRFVIQPLNGTQTPNDVRRAYLDMSLPEGI